MKIRAPRTTTIAPHSRRRVDPSIWFTPSSIPIGCLHVFDHRDQVAHHTGNDRTHGDHKERRKDAEEDRKDQFDGEFGRQLLSFLTSHDPHVFRMTAKTLRNARAEFVRLDEDGYELLDF